MKFFTLVFSFALAGVFQLSAQIAPLKGSLTLDGKLDESAWKQADPQSGFSILKSRNINNLKPAQTEFRVLADAKNLYLGIRCSEPDMKNLTITAKKGFVGSRMSLWTSDKTLEPQDERIRLRF